MAKRKRGRPAGMTYKNKSQEFPGVGHYRDRHGKLRWRYRYAGRTINLGTDYGSPEFIRRYEAAVKGERLPAGEAARRYSQAPRSGLPAMADGQHALADLIRSWYTSAQYTQLGDVTKHHYRLIAEHLRDEHGHRPVEGITRAVVKRLMAQKADRPEAANKLLRVLRFLLDHAVDSLEWIETNPAREVKKFAAKNSEGYHTWTEKEIARYFKAHPIGTTPDLAMALMLYTGAARADAVQLGPKNISDDGRRISYRRQKMRTRNGVLVDIPIHPDLAQRDYTTANQGKKGLWLTHLANHEHSTQRTVRH